MFRPRYYLLYDHLLSSDGNILNSATEPFDSYNPWWTHLLRNKGWLRRAYSWAEKLTEMGGKNSSRCLANL